MRLTRKAALFGALFALTSVFTLAACSDDNNNPQNVDLSGNYIVTAIAFPANANEVPVFNPAAGSATLTATTYSVNIETVGTSEGTYTALDDGTFTQNGTVTPVGSPDPIPAQCTGTWSLNSNTSILTIDTTCLGSRTVTQFEPAD